MGGGRLEGGEHGHGNDAQEGAPAAWLLPSGPRRRRTCGRTLARQWFWVPGLRTQGTAMVTDSELGGMVMGSEMAPPDPGETPAQRPRVDERSSSPPAGKPQAAAGASADQSQESAPGKVGGRRGPHGRIRRGTEAVQAKYSGSSAEHLWRRLDSMDFINRGMLFAAVLLLCFFPFLIIVNALAGQSAATGLIRHLGLSQQAAADVSHLFTSSSATSSAVTGGSWVFFVLGGMAAGTAIQELYERAFDLEGRGMKGIPRRLIWLAVLVGSAFVGGLIGPAVRGFGGPVLLVVIGLAALTAFWWFTMWLLLAGRIPWKDLFPSALATGICWVAMQIVFSVTFSSTVISYNKKYGPIGVVFALMSWLIAIGVVIILGAVAGLVWRERNLSFSAAFKKLRRHRSAPNAKSS